MKHLIVNADDLGADEARNAGIFEAIEAGVVTSVSLLANGPALSHALHRLRPLHRKNISVGAHLNLSEGRPLSSGLTLLLGPDGSFLGKAPAHKLLMRSADSRLDEEVHKELTAQMEFLRQTGLRIDHVDGHQHIHVFPAVIQVAVKLAGERKIPWMRLPEEALPSSSTDDIPDSLKKEGGNFSRLARAARAYLPESGILVPDHFRGLFLKGRVSLHQLMETLPTLQPGLTELMVHPGRVPVGLAPGPFSAFSTFQREEELEALMDEALRLALVKAGIHLTPFPEVQD